jgi:predicted Rossmann-fold nucleotide-binding protein
MHLVYGGGTVGMMGELAKTLVSLSGPETVHGIIPKTLKKVKRNPDNKSNSKKSSNKAIVTKTSRVGL